MMRVRVYDPVTGAGQTGKEELLGANGLKWIDVLQPTAEVLELLAARYGLHRLAIEDCLHLDQRPKIEQYPGHQFIVLQGFSCEGDIKEIKLHEMHFFLGADWVITVHSEGHEAIEKTHLRLDADLAGSLGRGADFVVYLVADALVDRNFPLLDQFNDELEELETEIFENPTRALLHRAFTLKRNLVQVRRVLSPQRDVVGLLSRTGVAHVQERTALYFRDIYDHLVRLYEQIDAARDLIGNAMDVYLSVVANKTNDITKQLTIFASIFMPLSFMVGFFGQNFDTLSRPGFFYLSLSICVALPFGMFGYFWKRGWL
jgi:magnesium transporter